MQILWRTLTPFLVRSDATSKSGAYGASNSLFSYSIRAREVSSYLLTFWDGNFPEFVVGARSERASETAAIPLKTPSRKRHLRVSVKTTMSLM